MPLFIARFKKIGTDWWKCQIKIIGLHCLLCWRGWGWWINVKETICMRIETWKENRNSTKMAETSRTIRKRRNKKKETLKCENWLPIETRWRKHFKSAWMKHNRRVKACRRILSNCHCMPIFCFPYFAYAYVRSHIHMLSSSSISLVLSAQLQLLSICCFVRNNNVNK